jgi:hypothetical protein
MGPYDIPYSELFLSVLKDWRVIAATVAILLLWALLRYVGVVFRRMKLNLPPPRKMLRKKKEAAAEAPAAESPEIEEEA